MILIEDFGDAVAQLPNPATLPPKRRICATIDDHVEDGVIIRRTATFEVFLHLDGRRAWAVK